MKTLSADNPENKREEGATEHGRRILFNNYDFKEIKFFMFISNLLISYNSLHTKYFSTRHWAGASGTRTYDRNFPSGNQNKKICLKKKRRYA